MTNRHVSTAPVPDVELRWTLVGQGRGSARFVWTSGPDSVTIGTSYVGDGLRGLLRAARDLQLGSSATFTHLLDEPHGYRIFFSGAAEKVYVQIVLFKDLYSEGKRWAGAELRWEGPVRTRQFIEAVIAMAERARRDYPDGEYERRWGFPFPDEELSLLREGGAPAQAPLGRLGREGVLPAGEQFAVPGHLFQAAAGRLGQDQGEERAEDGDPGGEHERAAQAE